MDERPPVRVFTLRYTLQLIHRYRKRFRGLVACLVPHPYRSGIEQIEPYAALRFTPFLR
jgi:hypothetical protein